MLVTNIINVIFFLLIGSTLLILGKNVMELMFDISSRSINKKRLDQLRREVDKKAVNNYETIERITEPVVLNLFPKIEKYLPSLRLSNLEQLQKDLKIVEWDDTFSPETFIATGIALKIIGVVVFLFAMVLPGAFKIIGFMFALALMFLLDYWFNSEVKSLKQKLFNDFPDFIRIVSGYLSADVPLVQSISDSVKYVGVKWKPILQQFVVDCDTQNINVALNKMKENVDLFEVKEFVALVRLTLEQGGNVKEGFLQQAEKVTELQKNLMIIKVGRRKTMSTALQGPLLLCNIVVLALPTFGQVMANF